MTSQERSQFVKRIASELGFAACGICRAEPVGRAEYVLDWLRAGRHGTMAYLERNGHIRLDPSKILPGAKSVIVVAWLYRVREQPAGEPASVAGEPDASESARQGREGQIARYAWGRDYHRVIAGRLKKLISQLSSAIGEPFDHKICVDTAPVIERELAARAGIGWIGKNCIVLNRDLGSYFCLGEVVTTLEIDSDVPVPDGCEGCEACLRACPTGALLGAYEMDAARCISYLTIECRENLPDELKPRLVGRLFGCDACQEACPYNGPEAAVSSDADAQARWPGGRVSPQQVLAWGEGDWDRLTRGRALRRAPLQIWQRNAEILAALGR